MVKFVVAMEFVSLAVLVSAIFTANGQEVSVKSDSSTINVRPGEEGIKYAGVEPIEGEDCGLRINQVTDAHAGEWKCSITAIIDGYAKEGSNSINLVVLKAPKSVSLDTEDMLTVTPTQKEATVRCTVEGGDPVPSFSWTMDGVPATGIKVVDSGEEGDGHFQVVSVKPNKKDNGKTLACVANSEAYTEAQIAEGKNTDSVALDVQYAPEPQKDDLQFYGLTVGQPTVIEIKFRLNPAPTNMEWVMADGTRVPQGSESNEGKYTASKALLEDENEPDLHTAKLTINEVAEQNGGTSNNLVVTNAHGEANISFQLEIGAKPPTGEDVFSEGPGALNDEAGTGPVIAIVIIILLAIVVIAVVVVARSQGLLCFAVNGKGKESEEKEKTVEKEEGDTESSEDTQTAVAVNGTATAASNGAATNGAAANGDAEKGADGDATETDGAAAATTANGKPKASLPEKMSSLFIAFKKAIPSPRKSASSQESEEVKIKISKVSPMQSFESLKDSTEIQGVENKDDIVYADLDKTALSDGNTSVTVENEKTEYAEIKPSNV